MQPKLNWEFAGLFHSPAEGAEEVEGTEVEGCDKPSNCFFSTSICFSDCATLFLQS